LATPTLVAAMGASHVWRPGCPFGRRPRGATRRPTASW
jgi:hypothetical protein